MKLWIARHSFAGPRSPDPKKERERPLKKKGVAIAVAMANAMKSAGEIPKVIFCSPFIRATQTADIFGKILGCQVNVVGDFSPDRPLEDVLLQFMGHGQIKRLLIVAHVDNTSPAMDNFGGDTKWRDLVMCEVRRVEIDRKTGEWSLKWGIRPSDLDPPMKDYA